VGRFQVEELVQSGGMGDVYRAIDLSNDEIVALKTLRSQSASQERFSREAARLSELKHPGIPRYIAHELAPDGLPFLAMEWLEGADLAEHLRITRLGLKSAVRLVELVCEAVGAAHQQGIVHRDINPSNLFLVGRKTDNIRVLDFGVARLVGEQPILTAEGSQIGTPGYMSPEQIEGRGSVGPAADVFALGCVLYETVTAQRAFYAPTIKELLARMLTEHPPAPSELHQDVPAELDALILRCLSKEPKQRPHDALELAELLARLPELSDEAASEARPSMPGSVEQQVTSVVVLRDGGDGAMERAQRASEPYGMRAGPGSDNTIVIATRGTGTAADHAGLAARCALAVQRATRATHIAVSTGLSRKVGEALSGRAFDAALVSLLMKHSDGDTEARAGTCLWLDENTAALLDSRFDVRAVAEGFLLRGLRETYEPARTVLGKRTRCVGRKRELSTLEATLAESFEDNIATSVLITGDPGIGKSRLAAEITRIARQKVPGVQIIRGCADAMTAGAPFVALSRAVARACRIDDSSPDSVRRSRLHERLESLIARDELGRVSEFLAELLGISVGTAASPQMEAARRDAVLRGDQIQRALTDWLRGECEAAPVLLVLEDFHWGDLPTVKFIDSALRSLAEAPLVVLALARPELHDLFPHLWVRRGVTELRLNHLSRRAVGAMIQEVLGGNVSESVKARVIRRAQGNPYWVEELLRAEDAGQGDNVPDRIVLLAQSRIESQSLEERRVLKAASVFGRQFWQGGAKAVLEGEGSARPLKALLRDLVESEFIMEHELSALGGEREFQFASGLLRDAAYSLLGEDEKEQAHLKAASWLEKNGDSDPLAVAMHFTLGGEVERARSHYLEAAEQALSGDDLNAAISCAEEGLAAGARGPDLVRLRLVLAEANRWHGDNAAAFRSAQKAFARAEDGTESWYRAAAEAAVAAGKIGKHESSLAIARDLIESRATSEALADRGSALSRVATQLVLSGQKEMASRMLDAVIQEDTRVEPDPQVMGYYHEALAVFAGANGDPVGRIVEAETAIQSFEDAGDLRNACLGRLSKGFAEVEFGANQDARITLERALEVARRMDLSNSVPVARAQLGRALGRLGEVGEGMEHLHSAAAAFDRQRNVRLSGMSRLYLAELHLLSDNLEAAQVATRRALEILQPMPPLLQVAQALSAALTVADLEGSQVEAESLVDEALVGLAPENRLVVGESFARVCAASALSQLGRAEEAQRLIDNEVDRVEALRAQMSPERAHQFCTGNPARAFLSTLDEKQKRAPGGIHFVRWLAESRGAGSHSIAQQTQEASTLAQVESIVAESRPVLRNLLITQSYHDLSAEIARVIDRGNVNWSTFACWASKTAGISIRNEDLPRFAQKTLGLESGQLPQVAPFISHLLDGFGLGRRVRVAVFLALREVSNEISLGNRKVYQELAPLFARFVDMMRTNPGEEDLERFTSSLNTGPIEQEGQELLKKAFVAWYGASRIESSSTRAQMILRANCQIGLHEQTRLQEHIQGALDAPIEGLVQRHLRAQLPRLIGPPLAWLIGLVTRGLMRRLRAFWQEVATRYTMNLALPGGNEISLGTDLPGGPGAYPSDLQEITDPKLEALLDLFDLHGPSPTGSGANNWAQLNDRMGFIVELFRARQQDLKLFDPPFKPQQEALLKEGKVPEGDL